MSKPWQWCLGRFHPSLPRVSGGRGFGGDGGKGGLVVMGGRGFGDGGEGVW